MELTIVCAPIHHPKARMQRLEATGSREVLVDESVHVIRKWVFRDQGLARGLDELVQGLFVLLFQQQGHVDTSEQFVELLLHFFGLARRRDGRILSVNLEHVTRRHASQLVISTRLQNLARQQANPFTEKRVGKWVRGIWRLLLHGRILASEAKLDESPDRMGVVYWL